VPSVACKLLRLGLGADSNPIAPTINYMETRPFTVAHMFKMSNRFTVNKASPSAPLG
jgi:hypothetical protein